jgi:hypothetical protein
MTHHIRQKFSLALIFFNFQALETKDSFPAGQSDKATYLCKMLQRTFLNYLPSFLITQHPLKAGFMYKVSVAVDPCQLKSTGYVGCCMQVDTRCKQQLN